MAVFYDTGGGDIYAGPDKEAVLKAMREDVGEDDLEESEVFEVPGTKLMSASDENEEPTGETLTLDAAYEEGLGSYCIASENA